MSTADDHPGLWRVVAIKVRGEHGRRIHDERYDTKREAHSVAERMRKRVMNQGSEKPGRIMRDGHTYRVATP